MNTERCFELEIKDWVTKERNSFAYLCNLLIEMGYNDTPIMDEFNDNKINMNKFIRKLRKAIKEE